MLGEPGFLPQLPMLLKTEKGGEKVRVHVCVCVCVFTVTSPSSILKGANQPVIFKKKKSPPASQPCTPQQVSLEIPSLPQGRGGHT